MTLFNETVVAYFIRQSNHTTSCFRIHLRRHRAHALRHLAQCADLGMFGTAKHVTHKPAMVARVAAWLVDEVGACLGFLGQSGYVATCFVAVCICNRGTNS